MSSLSKRHFQSIRPRSTEAEIIPAIEALEAQENISISTLISISMDFGNQSSLLSLPSICDSSPIPPQLQSTTMSSNNTTTNDSKKRKNREESYVLFICSAISSSEKCLCVSKTESYGLSRICFEMTRQATMPSSSEKCLHVSKTESYTLSRICFEMTRQATLPSSKA
jgi:hypothetical protein